MRSAEFWVASQVGFSRDNALLLTSMRTWRAIGARHLAVDPRRDGAARGDWYRRWDRGRAGLGEPDSEQLYGVPPPGAGTLGLSVAILGAIGFLADDKAAASSYSCRRAISSTLDALRAGRNPANKPRRAKKPSDFPDGFSSGLVFV